MARIRARDREPNAYKVTIGKCLEVTKSMHAMVNNLLTLARAESNTLKLQLEQTNIREFLRERGCNFLPRQINVD